MGSQELGSGVIQRIKINAVYRLLPLPGRNIQEAVAARIACHASVRGSTVLGPEEFNALLAQLDQARDPEHCPHGRPTRLKFSLAELRKLFKRS